MISLVGLIFVVILAFVGIYKVALPNKPISLTIDTQPKPIEAPRNLSAVAQQVYKEYMSLPAETRPFNNILDILKSLDAVTATPNNNRRDHFDANANVFYNYAASPHRYGFKFDWDNERCDHKTNCKYSAYYELHVEIARVKKALDDKARALVESENAHNVAMAAELVAALREEAGIQTKVTQEIRGDA